MFVGLLTVFSFVLSFVTEAYAAEQSQESSISQYEISRREPTPLSLQTHFAITKVDSKKFTGLAQRLCADIVLSNQLFLNLGYSLQFTTKVDVLQNGPDIGMKWNFYRTTLPQYVETENVSYKAMASWSPFLGISYQIHSYNLSGGSKTFSGPLALAGFTWNLRWGEKSSTLRKLYMEALFTSGTLTSADDSQITQMRAGIGFGLYL